MNRLIARLPKAVWLFLPEAALRLWLVRIALWFLPYGRVIQLCGLEHVQVPPSGTEECPQLAALRRAVDVAARRLVPASTCLCQALAAHGMLRSRGFHSSLAVGLLKDSGQLSAHAWLQLGSCWVTGRSGHEGARMIVWFH